MKLLVTFIASSSVLFLLLLCVTYMYIDCRVQYAYTFEYTLDVLERFDKLDKELSSPNLAPSQFCELREQYEEVSDILQKDSIFFYVSPNSRLGRYILNRKDSIFQALVEKGVVLPLFDSYEERPESRSGR